PLFAGGQTAMRIISQRVAPSPNAASRYVAGTERTASSETDTIIGSTMIARISTAQSMFRGSIGSRKNGVQPNSFVSTGTLWFITNGASTKTPHSPYTTLGTDARISMTNRTIPLSCFGKTSLMNVATEMPTGAAIASARIELTSVPRMN